MIDNLLIAVHTFAWRILMSLSVETLLPRYVNLSTNFREPLFSADISFLIETRTPFCLHSYGDQYLLLPAPDYAAKIQLGFVYLQEAQYHLCSLHA